MKGNRHEEAKDNAGNLASIQLSFPIEFHTLIVGHITADLGDCLCARLQCYHRAIAKRVQHSNTSALLKIHHLALLNKHKLLAVEGG